MQLRSGWRAAAIAVLCLGVAAPASALSLGDLNAGDMFTSGNGALKFSFGIGSVVVAGSLNSNLDNYLVVTLDNGFRVVGPIGVADGNVGDILLDYSVSATNVLNPIISAHLSFNGSAFGLGSTANIAEDFSNGESLAVAVTGGGFSQKTDWVDFPATDLLAVVLKDIQVISVDVGHLASISVIDQRFNVVPEPGTAALMLGGGLVGIAALGRSRRRA